MTKYETFLRLLCLIPIVLFFVINVFGMRYDSVCEKYDKGYQGNHGIIWNNGKFCFSFPKYIFKKTINNEIQKARKDYNSLSVIFWLTTIITTILFIVK